MIPRLDWVPAFEPLPPDGDAGNPGLGITLDRFLQFLAFGGDGMDAQAGKIGQWINTHDGKE